MARASLKGKGASVVKHDKQCLAGIREQLALVKRAAKRKVQKNALDQRCNGFKGPSLTGLPRKGYFRAAMRLTEESGKQDVAGVFLSGERDFSIPMSPTGKRFMRAMLSMENCIFDTGRLLRHNGLRDPNVGKLIYRILDTIDFGDGLAPLYRGYPRTDTKFATTQPHLRCLMSEIQYLKRMAKGPALEEQLR